MFCRRTARPPQPNRHPAEHLLRGADLTSVLPLVVLATLLSQATLLTQATCAETVRVLTYNIHHGRGTDDVVNLARIARVIRSVEPDIVALQEVDENAERTGVVDQPATLARLTGLPVIFGPNIPLQGGRYGNALLTRFPVLKSRNVPLPSFTKGEQRGALIADLQLGDRIVTFYATHFDFRRDNRERLASVELVNQLTAHQPDRPALLAGDLNAMFSSPTLSLLRTHWTVANDEPKSTFPTAKPTRQIDFVLFRPTKAWRVREVRVLDAATPSDHRALLAAFQIP